MPTGGAFYFGTQLNPQQIDNPWHNIFLTLKLSPVKRRSLIKSPIPSTLGDAKVKNLNAPLRAIAHNPTDTIPSVPPEVLDFSPKCWNFSPKCWNFETLSGGIMQLSAKSPVILMWRSP
ncbi:hypothetical protein [Arthrospira platensis]|uniref:hypothetical protein n=1 Tax=Limnospira platensis TaxID=118562 RepID=UPI000B0E4426